MNSATDSVVTLISGISGDVFGVVGLIILLIALGLSKGKDNLLVLMISLYPSALLTEYFPFYDSVLLGNGHLSKVLTPLAVYLISAFAISFFLHNYIDTNYQHSAFWRFVEIFVLSLSIVGISIAVFYHIVGIEPLYNFSFVFDALFASNFAMFLWLLLPIVSIPLFIRA